MVPHGVLGTEGGREFSRAILDDEMALDVEQSQKDLIRTARLLKEDHPEVGVIVLESTNMPPYAAAIQREVGPPVFDIYTLVNMVYLSVVRKAVTGFM
jgi:hypothetical protein